MKLKAKWEAVEMAQGFTIKEALIEKFVQKANGKVNKRATDEQSRTEGWDVELDGIKVWIAEGDFGILMPKIPVEDIKAVYVACIQYDWNQDYMSLIFSNKFDLHNLECLKMVIKSNPPYKGYILKQWIEGAGDFFSFEI